ncbi:hypothetical protein FB45DRAFT_889214 [Roridomyces roridus]|uniref:Uncharacterized protein n=1 Tax=Roridomyces roridus TaxID=1738132 RepID=A0AAD7CKM6_9AGAR|nr:hypothetical protein FB45DRAFT_889214 [Roridomyces roridus]
MKDVIVFSISCQDLWEIGRLEIYRRIVALAASFSWVGDRIVCIGHHCPNKELPKGLLTLEEQQEFAPYGSLYKYPFRDLDGEERMNRHILRPIFESRLSEADCRLVRHVVDWDFKVPEIEPTSILRNLSRRQYFCGATLANWKHRTNDMNMKKRVGFNEVVLSRICFSSDPATGMAYSGDIHRGVWAGDRFDFVDCDWLGSLEEDERWTDVSDEVLKEIEAIWKVPIQTSGE